MPFHLTRSGVFRTPDHSSRVEDPSKTYICCCWFPSTSEFALCRFLGMSSYYHRFVPNFWKIPSPLQSLTHKDVQFVWTDECAHSFQMLKEKLTCSPCLYPLLEKPFVFETDASIERLGAVSSQWKEDGLLHPVAFASRSLMSAESNYLIIELKTLAVV